MIVGFQAGDNHDLWMRFYARFLGKQIPGNPDFFVQNMPGAGGMIAANQLYNLTKPDGLTLAPSGALSLWRSSPAEKMCNSTGRSFPGS